VNRNSIYIVLFTIASFVVFFSSCDKNESESFLLNKILPKGIYGKPFSSNNPFTVSDLINNSMDHLDKNIIVTGKIIEVCPMRGCWAQIIDPDGKASIRIKVDDGEIVFPLSAVGADMIVKGILKKRVFSQKQARDWKVHLAEEKGLTLNSDSIIIEKNDLYEYRVECFGAIIL